MIELRVFAQAPTYFPARRAWVVGLWYLLPARACKMNTTSGVEHFDENLRDCEPLAWWRDHQRDFPIRSRMAFDLLGIPGMSTEEERMFSMASYGKIERRSGNPFVGRRKGDIGGY